MPEETTQIALSGEPPIAENEQVKALLVLLKENDTPGWREFAVLISHVSGMERQLSEALEELQAIRQKMDEVQDRSLKAALQKAGKSLEKNVDALRQRLSTLKEQIVGGCKNILEDFKVRGSAALNGITGFLHLKPVLKAVQSAAKKSIEASDRAAARIDAFSTEFHEAGRHLRNMGRSIRGMEAQAEAKENGKIARAFKGGFQVERAFLSAVEKGAGRSLDSLARLEQAAQRRPSVLKTMKEQAAKTEKERSVPAPSRDKGSR